MFQFGSDVFLINYPDFGSLYRILQAPKQLFFVSTPCLEIFEIG